MTEKGNSHIVSLSVLMCFPSFQLSIVNLNQLLNIKILLTTNSILPKGLKAKNDTSNGVRIFDCLVAN